MKETFFMLLVLIVSVSASFAEEEKSGYIQITVVNKAIFPKLIQIKDEVCKLSISHECEEARIELKRKECRNKRYAKECKEARAYLESSSCVAGLIYEGMVDSGQEIQLSTCKSPAEYGTISIRDINRATLWKNYRLISDGDTVGYP